MRRGEKRGRPVNISRFESSRHVQSMISGSPAAPSAYYASTLSLDHGKQMRRDNIWEEKKDRRREGGKSNHFPILGVTASTAHRLTARSLIHNACRRIQLGADGQAESERRQKNNSVGGLPISKYPRKRSEVLQPCQPCQLVQPSCFTTV